MTAVSATTVADVVCPCFNVTLADLERRKRANPALSFEDFMSDTGAGTKCTACLLDLEYHFVMGREAPAASPAGRRALAPRLSAKRRVYAFLDRIAPKRPTISRTVAPVVAGEGIDEFLWLANHPLLFDKNGACAPPHVFDIRVTDDQGRTVLSERHVLEASQSVRIDISAGLRQSAGASRPLAVGMLGVEAQSTEPGVRGTTRPQIEIVAGRSACAVHTQGASPQAGDGSVWLPCRPGEDRIFIVFMNPSAEPCNVRLRYPADAGEGAVQHRLRVAPRAAACHEVDLPAAANRQANGGVMRLGWRAAGPHKAYFLCASPTLDRFSVDHL